MTEEDNPRRTTIALLEKNVVSKIRNIVDYVPLASAFLVFLGYWNLSFYYERFDISIYNYISITEIFTSFLPIIKETFLYACAFIVLVVLLVSWAFQRRQKPESELDRAYGESIMNDLNVKHHIKSLVSKSTYAGKKFSLKLWWSLHHFWYSLIIIGGFTMGIVFIYLPLYSLFARDGFFYSSSLTLKYISCFCGLLFVAIIADSTFKTSIFEHIMKALTSKYGILVFFFLTISITQYQKAYIILDKHQSRFVSLIMNDSSTIKTDSNFVFIGQSQNNFFFRNLKDRTNSIYKTSDIKSIVMK